MKRATPFLIAARALAVPALAQPSPAAPDWNCGETTLSKQTVGHAGQLRAFGLGKK